MIPKISASSLLSLALVVGLTGRAAGQGERLRIEGQVVRRSGTEQVPFVDTWVVLHTITPEGGSPADSIRPNRNGRFRFSVSADSSSVYLVSTTYAGIAYFSRPVHGFSDPVNELAPLVVFDTTSGAPAVSVSQRHVVVGAVKSDGSHDVIDILELVNAGSTTRVSASDGDPTWIGTVPPDVLSFAVGDGDVGPDAVRRRGDSVLVFAPVPPGSKQLTLSYVLPGDQRELRLTVDQPILRFNVLTEDLSAEVLQGPLVKQDPRLAEGRAFQFFVADTVPEGATIALRLAGSVNRSRTVVGVVVVGMTGVLVLGIIFALRKQPVPAQQLPVGADAVAARIAELDREWGERRDAIPAAEWERYQCTRAELKEQLKAALAGQLAGG